jgi:hypothetical protein
LSTADLIQFGHARHGARRPRASPPPLWTAQKCGQLQKRRNGGAPCAIAATTRRPQPDPDDQPIEPIAAMGLRGALGAPERPQHTPQRRHAERACRRRRNRGAEIEAQKSRGETSGSPPEQAPMHLADRRAGPPLM